MLQTFKNGEAESTRMRLSVLDLAPVFESVRPADALERAVELACAAEKLGYKRYWVAEHHDMQGLACTSPEVLLAYIGARTERIRLGSGALLLPHYKPMKVAESFHLLASLCPGRIDLGIGRAPGGSAHVSMALSGNFLENVQVTARPVPPVPPEVWMLGTNRKSASYAAEFGTGYVFGRFMSDEDGLEIINEYRQSFKPSGLLAEPRIIVAVSVICADTEEEAKRLAAKSAAWFQPRGQAEGEAEKGQGRKLLASTSEAERGRQPLVGTPDQVKARLKELSGIYAVDEFMVVSAIPDYGKRLYSYGLLARAIAGNGQASS